MNEKKLNLDNDEFNENITPSTFQIKTVNQWINDGLKLPKSKPLFGSIWHEYEVAIAFGNTGKGKSINSYQIFDAISKGSAVLDLQTTKAKVLYFDFELSSRSLVSRYTNLNDEPYYFDDSFLRAEIDYGVIDIESVSIENGILKQIEEEVFRQKPSAICIDNISFISTNNEKSKDALELLKGLLKISRKLKVAILVLAHRPKNQTPTLPITLDHLAGSKALSNFCDQCFSICDSVQSTDIIYIKELKNRNRAIVYDSENVIECRIVKDDKFLKFEKLGLGRESDHLFKSQDKSNPQLGEILELKKSGFSNVKIGEKLGISEGTVRNILKKIE